MGHRQLLIGVLAALAGAVLTTGAAALAHTGPLPRAATTPGWLAAPAVSDACPTEVDASQFASADALYAANRTMADHGARPTGSPAHARFVASLAERLAKLPGVELRSIRYPIERWTDTKVALRGRAAGGSGAERLRVAAPIPYAKATPKAGIAGELVYLPEGQTLEGHDLRGKIVVRDTGRVSVPNAALAALSWFSYDPEAVLIGDVADSYVRENVGEPRQHDMREAARLGAAGVIFLSEFPYEQARGQYAPYEGVPWPVPAILLGADEGARIRELAGQHGSARITLRANTERVATRMLLATLPGLSDERIVVQSHTDGMNGVWDNGPVAMVAMADWFARMGRDCRPRTLTFAFTTGHLYQHLVSPDRDGSAEQLAKQLDSEYDDGKASLVIPMEHMGAKGWEPRPRGDGKPGSVLVPAKYNDPTSVFIGESPALVSAFASVVAKHDLRETIALRGADLPGLQLPPHDSFGGEGNPYQHHLIPTVSLVTGPWTLFNPAFTLEQTVDPALLHRQSLVFTDLVHTTATIPRELLGGAYVGYRQARALTCGSALEALALVRHCNAGQIPVNSLPDDAAPEGTGTADTSCRSRRVVRITLPRPRDGGRLRRAVVTVNGTARRTVAIDARRRVTVTFAGRRGGRVVVRVVARTRGGATATTVRRYRLCTPGPR